MDKTIKDENLYKFSPFDEITDSESITVSKNDDSIKIADNNDVGKPLEEGYKTVGDEQCNEEKDQEEIEEISDEEEDQENIEETSTIIEENHDVSNLEKFEELNGITPKMINILKMKLNKYREYKNIFESIDKINLEIKFDELPDINDKKLMKSLVNNTNDIVYMNKLNVKLTKELKQCKQQLENRTKQLEKATELLTMMKKGLSDRGQYIKMLIEDNKRLREEVKFSIEERKSLCEKFANDFDDLPLRKFYEE